MRRASRPLYAGDRDSGLTVAYVYIYIEYITFFLLK